MPQPEPQNPQNPARAKWFYRKGEHVLGPVRGRDLRALARAGQLDPLDLIRKEGMAFWVPAGRSTTLFSPPEEVELAARMANATDLSDSAVMILNNASGSIEEEQLEPLRWFYRRAGRTEEGPLAWTALRELALAEALSPYDELRREDSTRWQPAGKFESLFAPPQTVQDIAKSGRIEAELLYGEILGKELGAVPAHKQELLDAGPEPYQWTRGRRLLAAVLILATGVVIGILWSRLTRLSETPEPRGALVPASTTQTQTPPVTQPAMPSLEP